MKQFEFPVAAAHPAMGTWGVQHPHTDVRDQGKKDTAKRPLCAPCKMPPRLQTEPQSAKGCPGWHHGAAQHEYKIQESTLSLRCDKGSGLNLALQLIVRATLSPPHQLSPQGHQAGPQIPVLPLYCQQSPQQHQGNGKIT